MISDQSRTEIHDEFWSLNYSERRLWMNSYIHINDVKRRFVQTGNAEPKKKHTVTYFLPQSGGKKIQVCKTMFLHTLGWKTDGVITHFVNSKTQGNTAFSPKDKRGKKAPPNKTDEDAILHHINSYHPQISHYRREHAPNRRYLESHLSIRNMWRDFCKAKKQVAYETY